MRDPGLSEAIQAAGGVSELARRVGISQPSVSNWDKVPAERVLSVDAATGVSRKVLRPDLYSEPEPPAKAIDEIDVARAQEYALISTLLVRAPNAAFLKKPAALGGDASPVGVRSGCPRRGRGGTCRGKLRAGGSRCYALRNHGRHRRRQPAGRRRRRPAHLRKTPFALDRTLLR